MSLTVGNVESELELHRVALTGYCYRMLGSAFEAEDAVQETMVRAWRNADRFEGRSTVRTWLHRIATNVCLDFLGSRQRRARPMDMGPAAVQPAGPGTPMPEVTWLTPIPDTSVLESGQDPADLAVARDSIRLAFVAALQHLPPRQRAVLILREVLHWHADEVAELLDSTVASVNSALQRARATLAQAESANRKAIAPDAGTTALAERFADAFERYDMDALVTLLHEDARMSMPPFSLWLDTHEEIVNWMIGPGAACRDSRLVPTFANGAPAFGQYKPDPNGTGRLPWSLIVLEVSEGRIIGLNHFLDTQTLFPMFGLPPRLD